MIAYLAYHNSENGSRILRDIVLPGIDLSFFIVAFFLVQLLVSFICLIEYHFGNNIFLILISGILFCLIEYLIILFTKSLSGEHFSDRLLFRSQSRPLGSEHSDE